jgi:hypothetical protein
LKKLNKRGHPEDPGVDGRVILKWVLEKWIWSVWIKFIWLRKQSNSGLL